MVATNETDAADAPPLSQGAAGAAFGAEGAAESQSSLDRRLQRLVPNSQQGACRASDRKGYLQPLCIGSPAACRSVMGAGSKSIYARFPPVWIAAHHSSGQRRTVRIDRASGSLSPECVVDGFGSSRRVYAPWTSRG